MTLFMIQCIVYWQIVVRLRKIAAVLSDEHKTNGGIFQWSQQVIFVRE